MESMRKNEKIKLIILSAIIILGFWVIIVSGRENPILGFFGIVYIWWTVLMMKFLVVRIFNIDKLSRDKNSARTFIATIGIVATGIALYVVPWWLIAIIEKYIRVRGF